MIIDTHAHYDDKAFDDDREELLGSLLDNKIKYVINASSDLDSVKKTLKLMEAYPFFYGAIGIHPSDADSLNEEHFIWLKNQLSHPKAVAVGEIGLDYYWDEPDRKIQKKWFERQIELAREVKKPVVVHSRDAAKDTLDMMKSLKADEIGGEIHCFSYSKETAREFLEMDFYFGIGGVITFQNAKKLKEAVAYIPIEKILLETDCPYLAPMPYRGKRNSSLYIPHIANEIAEIKGLTYEEVIKTTYENALRLFQMKVI